MSNGTWSSIFLVLAAVFLVQTAITGDTLPGVLSLWNAIFSVEYGIKHYIDEKGMK